jgi:hypothetical protein
MLPVLPVLLMLPILSVLPVLLILLILPVLFMCQTLVVRSGNPLSSSVISIWLA